MAYEMLLSPIKIGNLTIKNRVAMTAMAVEAAELDGEPVLWYATVPVEE